MNPRSESATRAERTRAQLERVADIPSLPPVLSRIWDLAAREDTSAGEMARVLSTDPGLTGAVLKLANSAYFGFPKKVATVTQAIVVLGFGTVKSLATGASVFRALGAGSGSRLNGRAFLEHGLTAAMFARQLVSKTAPRDAGSAFVAGILHDVGRLVIVEYLGDAYERIGRAVAGGSSEEQAEADVLGMGHGAIGHWFAKKWRFPDELSEAILWHHSPRGAGLFDREAALVHVADWLAHQHGANGSGRAGVVELDDSALELIGVTEPELKEIQDEAQASSSASAAGLVLGA